MDAKRKDVYDIFNVGRKLEIPFFQRSYVWGEPQWERMLEDVESLSRAREPYFMGPIILKQKLTETSTKVGDIRTVIDGQQRLTTLSVLLKVLCLKTDNLNMFNSSFRNHESLPVLQHNRHDIATYNRIMNMDTIEELESNDNLALMYKYFVDNLNPENMDYTTICNKISFVGIDLGVEEDEQQIFDTINSLGVSLTTAELLKNYFFNRDDIGKYHEYWFEIFEKDDETKEYWDRSITTGRLKRSFIDLFFFSFLQIKIQDPSLKVVGEDKIVFSKVERLFDSYKRFIKQYLNDDKTLILEEIRQYALVFKSTFDSEIIEDEIPATGGIERLNTIIFALDTATLIPYTLYVEKNVSDISIKNQLYEYLEAYIMRRLVTRSTTKNYNQLFAERLIINRILSKADFINYISGQEDKINRMPSDDDVRTAFKESVLTNKYATGVLYMIESKIRNRSLHSTQLLGINKYSLEHIMPKKWRNHWIFTGDQTEAEARDKKLLTLGNLTIITQSLNASIRDSNWNIKKSGSKDKGGLKKYAEGIETLSPYMEKEMWDENEIQARATSLSDIALEIWGI